MKARLRGASASLGLLALLAVLALALTGSAGGAGGKPYEVWAVDQSNTNGTTSGGTLYIYDGGSLERRGAAAVPERIDLGGAATQLCLEQTGTAPVRPHMVLFNERGAHALLSFVASGHVLFLDARTRTPVACIDVGVQAHAATPSPDESYAIVTNQNGKLLQRIATDYATGTFTLEPAATLDLANGTTPSGALRQDSALRPDNAPICALVDSSSGLAFVTLRGGGLFVVDPRATPMRIVAEYDRETIHGNGCGGLQAGERMYVNSGGGTAANLSEFDVYSFDLDAFGGGGAPSAPNTPAPELVVSLDGEEMTDSHGMALVQRGRYLWVADRMGNRIVVIRAASGRVVGSFPLTGALSDDPSLDLLDVAPDGRTAFVSLRGSLPLSGDPHASTGSTPGVGVIDVRQGGRRGFLEAIARIANVDAGGIDRADPHGIRVRLK
ncbi:MAG: YncE family protein [Gaiellaceae bacterium]